MYLKSVVKQLNGNIKLPLNYNFLQLYATNIEATQNNLKIPPSSFVNVEKYNTNKFELIQTLGKPISKILKYNE